MNTGFTLFAPQVWTGGIPGTSIPYWAVLVVTVIVIPFLVIFWNALSPTTGIDALLNKIRQLRTFFMVFCIWYFVAAFLHFFAVKYSSAKGLALFALLLSLLWWFVPYLFMLPAMWHLDRRTADLESIQAVASQLDDTNLD